MPKRILVVDADKEMRDLAMYVLTCNGFIVVTASHGMHLQRLLAVQLPDLIILDVVMPGVDGYVLFRRLRDDPLTRHIPVMIVTAHAENIYERISVDLGAARHMTKPFHPLELVENVKSLLQEK